MAFIKLQFKPGVNRDQTNYTGEGGWWDIDKVRFFSGFPQKLGGWVKYTTNEILGTCRQMWNWITTYSDNFMALGTNKKVYIEAGGAFNDITPLRPSNPTFSTPTTDNCIQTSNGLNIVTVNVVGANAVVGNYVTISGVSGAVGGIPAAELNANHEILTAPTVNSFTIQVATAATSTVASGGGTAITVSFEITIGNPGGTFGYGWGAGVWQAGSLSPANTYGWGLGSTTPIALSQRDWWFDNFDNDLVMNIRNGAVYYWERGTNADPAIPLAVRAQLLSTFATTAGYNPNYVPTKVMQILVSQQDKHLIAFGAVPYGYTSTADFDPLLIRWANQDDPFQWNEDAVGINTAGSLRISRGSRIVRALPTRQEILVWTDSHLYTLQYVGGTDIFSPQEYADNISIMSPRSVATASNITYWMGHDKFYAYTGRVETLPCTVRQYVFNDLNYEQSEQIVCSTNEGFNEIWWFYPSSGSVTNDRYVVLNHLEKIWYYGELPRTAWSDSPSRKYPQAIATDFDTQIGTMYNQEYGVDADGAPMESYIQSNDFDVEDGFKFILTKRIIPDINFTASQVENPEVTMKIRSRNFPGSDFNTGGDDTANVVAASVDSYTQQVFMRVRARQIALRIESDTLGTQWQLGSPRLDARTDGER